MNRQAGAIFFPSVDRFPGSKEVAQTQTLFVIAFIGSLDDLTLFVPMLVGKGLLGSARWAVYGAWMSWF